MQPDDDDLVVCPGETWEATFLRNWRRIGDIVQPLVVGIVDRRAGLIGSGILARHRASYFVLTVGHVVRAASDALRGGDLGLSTLVKRGGLLLPNHTEAISEYDTGEPYKDVGALRLDPVTAGAITAWTANGWFRLPEERAAPRRIDEEDRVFFAAGFPAAIATVDETPAGGHLRTTLCIVAWHRHPTAVRDGAICFGLPRNNAIDLASGQLVTVPALGGLSGAPIWTFDVTDERNADGKLVTEFRLIGAHAASGPDTALAIHMSFHMDLLERHGWI